MEELVYYEHISMVKERSNTLNIENKCIMIMKNRDTKLIAALSKHVYTGMIKCSNSNLIIQTK